MGEPYVIETRPRRGLAWPGSLTSRVPCTATGTTAYDDAGRKINGRVDGCSPNPTLDVSSYDAAGNLVSYVSRNGGSTYSWTSVVTATTTACLGG